MSQLVEYGANVNSNPYRGTPLLWSIYSDSVSSAKWLIEQGADPNLKHNSHPWIESALSLVLDQYPENGNVLLDANLATYQPNENFNGTDSFGFKANDGQYNSDLGIISLTINPINDAPVLIDIENQTIN